jgi:hypothetical protein
MLLHCLGQWSARSGHVLNGRRRQYAVAEEGKYAEVLYKAPRPAGGKTTVTAEEADQVDRVSFVTKVEGQICGVGYYK